MNANIYLQNTCNCVEEDTSECIFPYISMDGHAMDGHAMDGHA